MLMNKKMVAVEKQQSKSLTMIELIEWPIKNHPLITSVFIALPVALFRLEMALPIISAGVFAQYLDD